MLRLGIQVVLLTIGGFHVAGIYYGEGRILMDGWEWVQGLADAVAEAFVSFRYFLGIGALLVLLVYGLWRVVGLGRRGVGFILNGHCVLTNPYRHGLVVGSTGFGKTGSAVEPCLREALHSGHAGPGTTPAFRGLEGAGPTRPKLKRFTKSFCTRRSI